MTAASGGSWNARTGWRRGGSVPLSRPHRSPPRPEGNGDDEGLLQHRAGPLRRGGLVRRPSIRPLDRDRPEWAHSGRGSPVQQTPDPLRLDDSQGEAGLGLGRRAWRDGDRGRAGGRPGRRRAVFRGRRQCPAASPARPFRRGAVVQLRFRRRTARPRPRLPATIRVTPVVDGERACVEWWATYDTAGEGMSGSRERFEKDGFAVWPGALRRSLE